MDKFIFFVIKLILVFIVICIFIYTKYYYSSPKLYNIVSKCPDLWEIIDDKTCKNINNLGLCSLSKGKSNIMKFNNPIYNGDKEIFYKCKWANTCNITWQGIDDKCI